MIIIVIHYNCCIPRLTSSARFTATKTALLVSSDGIATMSVGVETDGVLLVV